MTIRVILLAVGPGVAGVRTGPLEISPGVGFGLTLAGVTLVSILVAMALDIGRLSLPFPLCLLYVCLLLLLRPLPIVFLNFCPTLSIRCSLLVRLSRPHIRLLVLILREEYFRSPPGGPSRARLITISRLQGFQVL